MMDDIIRTVIIPLKNDKEFSRRAKIFGNTSDYVYNRAVPEITLGGHYIPGTTLELKHDPAKVKNKNESAKSPYDLKKGDSLYVNQLPRSRTAIRGRFTRPTRMVCSWN